MADGAREITPMTFLNDDHGKSTIRDFSPRPQAVERRLEAVPEPTEVDLVAVVEPPVLTPEEEEALAAEAARADAELAAGTPDPTSPPAATGTPEATDAAPPVPQPTSPAPKRGPAPA